MKTKANRNLILACGVAVATLLVAACGKKEPAEIVRQRAVERWNLVANQQLVKAYDYLSPGYRATHTLEQYVAFIATSRVRWKSANIDAIKCEEDVCTAKLTVVSVLPGALLQRPSDMEYASPIDEKWIFSDGQWYFLPESKINAGNIAVQSEAQHGAAAPSAEPSPNAPASAGGNKEKGNPDH